MTPAAMDLLIRYPWPGNVRELMNAIERAVVLSTVDHLDVDDFMAMKPIVEEAEKEAGITTGFSGDMKLEDVEKTAILQTLESANGNKSETARRLGITRKTLHKKLKIYGEME